MNYLKITYRSLLRNKVNSLINIAGLSISIACCIAIYVSAKHEQSFDNFHSKADRIYRIVSEYKHPDRVVHEGYSGFPVAKALRNDFPALEAVTQVYMMARAVISIPSAPGERKIFEENEVTYADPYLLKTFDYPVLAGTAGKLLTSPDEVILTKKLADKFYGKEYQGRYQELIGRALTINKNSYHISAILKDIPRNSNILFRMLLPFEVFERENPKTVNNWDEMYAESNTFVTLPAGYKPEVLEKALVPFRNKYYSAETAGKRTFHLQALKEVHTDETYRGTFYATPHLLIGAFTIMGIIVLFTSCINFINLATAQSVKRAKETGIRKTLGSSRRQLMLQFMTETFLLVFIASVIAVLLARFFLDEYNQYLLFIVDMDLHIDLTIIGFLLILVVIITFLAGFYPAWILSGFRPIEALKQKIHDKNTSFSGSFSLRKVLVVTQFTFSQLLILGTIVVASQMRYFFNHDPGYRREGILVVDIPENDPRKLDLLRSRLSSSPQIEELTFCSGPPASASNGFSDIRRKSWPESEKLICERKFADPYFLPAFSIKLLAGRNLRKSDKTDLNESKRYNAVLNLKATKVLGFKNAEEAIGQEIAVNKDEYATIIGVTADFFNVSLRDEIKPCLLFYGTNWVGMAGIKTRGNDLHSTLALVKNNWEQVFPDYFFKAYNMDEYIKNKAFYIMEDIMYQAFKIFSMLAIFIGCMGLYGLVAFLAAQRQKEIGIRKVLGASVNGIVTLFSKEFAWLLLLAFALATPLAYWAMSLWLETFAHRIVLSPLFFILTFLISAVIAALTIGFQAVKAATTNPVKSLRTE